jgi:hypothetical protein
MITSIVAELAFDKIQHTLMTKAMKKLGIKEMYLNAIKIIFGKPITDIILNGELPYPFPPKSGVR